MSVVDIDALPRLKDALDASHGLRPTAIKQETQDKPVLLSLTPEIAPYLNIFNNRNFTSREIEGDSIIAKVVRFQAIEAFNSPPYIPRLKARGLYGDLCNEG